MSEKNILEQALLQINTLEEAVKQNAKGILASTMKQELNDLLKESLEEEEVDEQAEEDSVDTDATPEEEETDDMSDEEATDDEEETDADDSENDEDLDNADDMDDESSDEDFDSEETDDTEDETSMDDEFGGDTEDFGGADETEEDDDVMDMTGASDDEVLKVFKAMKPEDGIVVKKDGNKLEVNDGEDEYIIKLDDEDGSDLDEEWSTNEEEMYSDDDEDAPLGEDETLYEIEIDEEEEETTEQALKGLSNPKKVEAKETALKGLSHPKKVEAKEEEFTEAARTKSNPHGNKNGMKRAGLPSKKMYKAGSGVHGINEEVENLKKQNSEYKKALVLFKEKLNEVAVFNANLAYATRLFTENSTTKQEKLNILKRFDSVSTLHESKNLFNTINAELSSKTTVTESVVEKISNNPSSSSSAEVLSEAKAYENPQFARIKEMMKKIK